MDMNERYKKYRENIRTREIRESQQGSAIVAAPAMLARLRNQVVDQVNEYNALFGMSAQDKHCRANFEDLANKGIRHGFEVSVGSGSVRVVLQEGTTIICFEFSGAASKKASSDCAEARPDENGNPGYWYSKNDAFVDEQFLSDIILEPVLCG